MKRWILVAAAIALAAGYAEAEETKGGPSMTQPQSVDEGLFVPINGEEQWITIRGRDLKNPVLLWLHGGPGLAMSNQAPLFFDWEKDFTIVQWDQPGGGATFARNMEKGEGPLTRDRYTKDGIAVAEFVRNHLHTDKMVLMGISWGTELGLRMIHERPELFSAYVGTAQVVSGPRGDKLGYELALKKARERGDKVAVAALEKVGPPPYANAADFIVRQQYVFPPGLPASPEEQAATAETAKLLSAPPPPDAHYIAKGLPKYDGAKQFIAVQAQVFPDAAKFEAEALGTKFTLPMFFFEGEDDINTPTELAREFYKKIKAPAKGFEIIKGAGHNTIVFHGELLRLLDKDVRPLVAKVQP